MAEVEAGGPQTFTIVFDTSETTVKYILRTEPEGPLYPVGCLVSRRFAPIFIFPAATFNRKDPVSRIV